MVHDYVLFSEIGDVRDHHPLSTFFLEEFMQLFAQIDFKMTTSSYRTFLVCLLILLFYFAIKCCKESRFSLCGSSELNCGNVFNIWSNSRIKVVIQYETTTTRLSAIDSQADSLDYSWEKKMLEFFSTKHCSYAPSDFQPAKWLQQIVIMIGVQKGGTKAIHTFLEENPMFASRCSEEKATKEIFFFSNKTHLLNNIEQRELQIAYSDTFQSMCPLAVSTLESNSSKMYVDDTPNYMQDSHEIPQLINCVMPRAKILAILRNPTDRAFSHYNFYLKRNWCTERTFDEWVDINIKELTYAGIVNASDPYEELLAWKNYNNNRINRGLRKCRTFVTRGLYSIQLLHFMSALEAAGRSRSDLHVLLSEKLSGDTKQVEYDTLVEFIQLAPHTLHHNKTIHATNYEAVMNESTQVKLETFFRPYNFRLYEMLDWDPVWEKNFTSESIENHVS
jgi:Sulfotransferase domain